MTDYSLDIVIPLWNRPVEVRAALASFVAASPDGRLIMVNNGCERETESILEEFAERLDNRALLLATGRNIGSIAAINLGLSKATAPFILVVTPFTRLAEGWFAPILSLFEGQADTGTVVLNNKRLSAGKDSIEADHGSFAAMVLKRSLFDLAGGFDDTMDGAEWALRDYARRALTYGFSTVSVYCAHIDLFESAVLGSAVRRGERLRLARQAYCERWGEPRSFLLICPEELFGIDPGTFLCILLDAARQGDTIIVTAAGSIARTLTQEGVLTLHENITFHYLPRFFPGKVLSRIIEKSVSADHAIKVISDNNSFVIDYDVISFDDFLSLLHYRGQQYFSKGSL